MAVHDAQYSHERTLVGRRSRQTTRRGFAADAAGLVELNLVIRDSPAGQPLGGYAVISGPLS